MAAIALAECQHRKVGRANGQPFCTDCGETIVSFSKDDTKYFDDATTVLASDRKAAKTIRKELDLLSLPDEIKDRADRIYAYKVGNNTYRANVRQEVKFSCIFEAYKEAGVVRDPNEIAQMLGIKRKGMSRGIMRCSSLFTGKDEEVYQAPLTSLDLVPEMLSRCGVQVDQCHLEDIERIYTYAKDRSELLNRSKPQSIAAALIFFYIGCMSTEKKITKNEIAKNCGISVMTLNKLYAVFVELCSE